MSGCGSHFVYFEIAQQTVLFQNKRGETSATIVPPTMYKIFIAFP
ncbi:MAG: hypothetical protein ACR2GD_00345 [Pyrinomonadaceae bacterium]